MVLKNYQVRLLDDFESYLSRTRELGDPSAAYSESTKSFYGFALRYRPLPGAETCPYVCLRVPTGGGKTRIAGQSIYRAKKALISTEHPFVLWLVPSEPIRDQTLYALRTAGQLLHEDMRSLFGSVNVLEVKEALSVQPSATRTSPTIIVGTMQSFKRENSEGLKAYRQNGALIAHFDGLSDDVKGDQSLVDLIRLHRPFIVVDEAHNQGQQLAVETLARLNPSCVLELTATPDRTSQPSNVLRSVSAATLQAEDMLKLPLELAVHPEWRITLREAIARLRTLEALTKDEEAKTGESIAPVVMLIQAQRKVEGVETLTPTVVKQILVDEFQVPVNSIAISTGEIDELGDRKIGDLNFPQFIITVDKLREGWDCPNAYVLFTFRNMTSTNAVEQILGRVLRMPSVRRKVNEALNRSYAYVVSDQLVATIQGLRDGLVQNGFERLDVNQLISSPEAGRSAGTLFSQDLTVPLPQVDGVQITPDADALAALPESLRERLELSPEGGTITIRGGSTSEEIVKVASSFSLESAASEIRLSLDTALASRGRTDAAERFPADEGNVVRIPNLEIRQDGMFDIFSESALLDAGWEIESFDWKLSDAEFSSDVEALKRAKLTISELEKITCDPYDKLESQLSLLEGESGWDAHKLTEWLDGNIQFPYASQDQKVAWLSAAVNWLLTDREPRLGIEELAYRKYRLRGAIERKLAQGLTLAKRSQFEELLENEDAFETRDDNATVFKLGRYGYNTPYAGLIRLRRHFFPVVGDLKPIGEEFECAEHIANHLDDVAWWIRNVDRKPTSFSLQTSSDRFYPDFLIGITGGGFVAVEYKGAHLAGDADSREKKRIGELWERRSGDCAFAWVEAKNWSAIAQAVSRCKQKLIGNA